jgi:tetratricopeptide (TPR) repeat protein
MKKSIIHLLLVALPLAFLSLNLDCAVSSEDRYKTEIKDGVKYFGEGHVRYREGIPFIYLKGSSYEIGLQYGVLLKEEMNSFYVHLDSFENAMMAKVYKESPWYMDIIIKISTPFVVKKKLDSFKKRAPKDYLAQLEGMSEGSGVPLNDILKVTFGSDWLMCSSFIINVNGRIIHGRNADHGVIDFFSKYPLIAHYKKDGKYSYIDIGIIGTPFAVTGINEHGLTLSWSQATTSTSKPFNGKGTTLMFNRILEVCRNLNDVDETSKNVDRFVTMIGCLEDLTGAAYDIVDQKSVRTDLKNNYIYATNRCVSQSMRKEYNSIFDMDWFNSARAYTYEKILSNSKEFTIDDAIHLLSNIDFYDYKGKVPPYGGGNINNRGTGSSVVLDPQNSMVYFAYGAPYGAFSRWIRYDYRNDEVIVCKNEDRRLHNPVVLTYFELERRSQDVDWQNEDELHQFVSEIERSSIRNAWTLHFLWWLYNAVDSTEKAEMVINELIEKYPNFQLGYEDMGDLCINQKKYEEAIEHFQEALNALFNNDAKRLYCYEQLAIAYNEIGDESKSLDCYRKALDLYNSYWIPKQSKEEVNRVEELLRNRN